jgi:tRNA nucleotidyltransferase (CCA-adding enzyme)
VGLNLEPIIRRITPTPKEHEAETKVIERVFGLLGKYDVNPIVVGSFAKDTDLSGNKDLDIFIQFPPSVSRDELEKQGLRIGKEVLGGMGVEYEIDYAEHPYVKGRLDEHTIEIVPCFSGGGIMSSVDRTPRHTTYVRGRLAGNGLNQEIRLLKQFMRGIGVYGAEAKVEGFSGYLVELLTIHYGSFIKTLEAARAWRLPQVIDTEHMWEDRLALPRFFSDANLIVVDPVDRNRNVAAAVSPECLAIFIVKSDEYVMSPSEDFFFPKPKPARSRDELKKALLDRKSRFTAVIFRHRKINTNTLYAQLRKTMKSMAQELADSEFKVFRSGFWTNESDTSAILFEFEVWELPELIHHRGPPLNTDPLNQEKFTKKYHDEGPYVKDGRWVVDTKRRHRRPEGLLSDIIGEKRGFGKNMREMDAPEILEDAGIFTVTDEGWVNFMNEYLE